MTAPATGRTPHLAELHRELGGRLEERPTASGSALVPVEYGSVPDEVELLREECCLADRCWVDVLEISGADRERFLSGMVTCEVRELGPAGGTFGFVTTRKGGVLTDFALLSLEERFLLELPAGRAQALSDHLGGYILADRVAPKVATDLAPLLVAGPEAKHLLRNLLGGALPAGAELRWGHGPAEIESVPVRVANRPLLGVDAWTVWVATEGAEAVARALLDAGAHPAGYDALETVRIEAGIPLWGPDYDESNLPQEAGLDEGLNFTKGCYLGQEVVARIHYRGGVNRRIVGIEIDGDEPPATGTELLLDGKVVGRVGSVALSPNLEGPIGLAMVHKKAAEPGTRLQVAGDGGEVEVEELPFVE
ncbi:MAG: glycine cleavage T C-terminal barrel domain-containing protein [Acidobacteriota bacterium]